MCCSCNRRQFLETSALATLTTAAAPLVGAAATIDTRPRNLTPARIRGAFFYPPAETVLAGECEDHWARHHWFTWPGNQFEPEKQQRWFEDSVRSSAAGLDLDLALDEAAIHTDAGVGRFIADITANRPDALLLFNFWNSFSQKLYPILDAYDGPVILYHPVGANHQLPPERFRTGKRLQYIHAIRHAEALERGLRAVHAWNRVSKSRLLRVSGQAKGATESTEPRFGTSLVDVPAAEFNDLFDGIPDAGPVAELAAATRRQARHITDLSDKAFLDAARAHLAVAEMKKRYAAGAITIECLFLKHRKPCLSFAINNGALQPCGCENDLRASLSLMAGEAMFGRGGFQHNPEFDLEENLYFASHCTCATKLHGPGGDDQPVDLRPFFHQMPKTLALDVQWPEGEDATLFKIDPKANRLAAWQGEIVGSPGCPPTGGCATRVLVRFPGVEDVCSVYPGPHPTLFCGGFARQARTFAQLYEFEVQGQEA